MPAVLTSISRLVTNIRRYYPIIVKPQNTLFEDEMVVTKCCCLLTYKVLYNI